MKWESQYYQTNRKFRFWRQWGQKKNIPFSNHGFTLIELLVAGVLSAVVILVAWSGLVSAMSMSQEAQARSARQAELNKALDFMTNEIRMARSINASSTLTANGTTVTLPDVVTSAGVNLASLGSYGTIGLYLERPTSPVIPTICPVGGPNGGAPPPAPADFDPIVYDIRPSPNGWLQPRMVARYGRVPAADGTINPCNNPISSDPIIDALSTTPKTNPTCSGGVLSGAGGFYSCAVGKQVNLFFQSDVSNVETRQISSVATSRFMNINSTQAASGLSLDMNVSGGVANLNWNWTGTPPTVTSYKVYKTWRGNQYTPYTGLNSSFSYDLNSFATSGDNICFWVVAQTSAMAQANSGYVQTSTTCTVY